MPSDRPPMSLEEPTEPHDRPSGERVSDRGSAEAGTRVGDRTLRTFTPARTVPARERVSGDCIWLSERAQRRLAGARRSRGY